MASVKQLEQMVKELETLKQKKARAEGEHSQLMKSLADMGYDSVEAAEAALEEMDDYIRTTGDDLDKRYQEFQTIYRDSF